jgi:hypothetical protein
METSSEPREPWAFAWATDLKKVLTLGTVLRRLPTPFEIILSPSGVPE